MKHVLVASAVLALALPVHAQWAVGTTQVALLSLETMGAGWLSGVTQARGIGARSVEHQQVSSWPVAAVEDTGIGNRATIALLHQLGTTEPCATTVGIQFIEPPDT